MPGRSGASAGQCQRRIPIDADPHRRAGVQVDRGVEDVPVPRDAVADRRIRLVDHAQVPAGDPRVAPSQSDELLVQVVEPPPVRCQACRRVRQCGADVVVGPGSLALDAAKGLLL